MPVKHDTSFIASLLNLFRVDAQVRGLRSRLDTAQHYLAAQEKQLRELQQQHEELAARRRQTQAKVANLEVEIAAVDERLEKYREDLNSSVTNKQYTAVLTELNTVKLNRNVLEERVLEEMERIEKLDAELTQADAHAAERVKIRDAARAQLDERQAEIGQRLTELESERAAAAAELPAAELELFNELAEQFDGEVMAQVQEIDRRHREYACSECNMHVPFEAVSLLVSGGNAIVRCSACGRILYIGDEMRSSLSKK